ncbi:ankyrin repeat domain containing protein [Ophiostoma piceae UAMH 11346]|uniref:Ankyrin repeat domain containing protein n=1 Tax=Ophiostoma piceae (strain UAMH 11346) TaxID=1262450 RepID=S3C381_OPHP1|nr:ankyrin repeat domain containing protein [Ophiostoma piceae UAMH 11346]
MAKTKESAALEACTKDTLLGNKISVRMLEYLSTVKNHPEGFELLAREFLDICRILFSIEAGLDDCSKTGRRFPPDMVVELERKFKTTYVDFQELDRMIHKFLEYENKGTVGRIQKGFRRMFPDHDIARMRESLSKSREALRMSALVFQWSLGDSRIEDSVGIGYTGLAAALERMHGNRPALTASSPPTGADGAAATSAPPPTANGTVASATGTTSTNGTNGVNGTADAASTNTAPPTTSGGSTSPNGINRTRTADLPALPNGNGKSMLDVGAGGYGARSSSMLNVNGHANGTGHTNGQKGHAAGHSHGHNGHANGNNGGVHVNGHGRIVHDDNSPLPSLPSLPPMQFMTERDSDKELFGDDMRMAPELRRRPSTSNNTINSARDINGIVGAALTTNSTANSNTNHTHNSNVNSTPTRSNTRVASTVATSSDSRYPSSRHHHDSNGLLENLEVMSITASTAADSDSHAHGLQPPTNIKVVHLKADPASMPKWAPRNTVGTGNANLRSALISAVQGANYTLVEQLLDRGVSADGGVLHEAVLHHDLESMRLLLLFGADPNGVDKDGISPLFACVEESFAEGATLLLKYGAEPNRDSTNPTKDTLESPLVSAFTTGKLGLAQLMLAYGGDPNQRVQKGGSSSDSDSGGDNSTTLLMGAIGKKKHRRLVDLLLAYGANPNQKDGMGTSPLFVAVQAGRSDIVTALLDHGGDANLPGPKHVLWPSTYHPSCLSPLLAHGADLRKAPGILELATSLNKLETVRVLIKAGVDANSKKDGVYTPLCTAIRDDHIDIFNFLLAHGADPNLPASEYPTWKCITHKRVHLLPPLLRAGADIHKPPGIAEMAVQVGNAEGLVWLLEQGGVQPDERNAKGHTPLTTALRLNRADLVQLLLDHGADAGARGEEWPLILAVEHPSLLERLLPHVSNPRAVRGVLERAVAAGELASVKMLLAAGVSIEDKTGGVFSPLTTSIREGHRSLTKFLLDEAGANPNAPGEHLPLVKALRRGHHDDDGGAQNLEWLLEHGGDINNTYRGWNAVMQVVEDGNLELLKLLVEKSGAKVDMEAADDDGRTLRQMAAERAWPEGEEYLLAHAKA